MEHGPFAASGDFTWRRSYDKASVERYLERAEAERRRLEAEIAHALDRIAVAEEWIAARSTRENARLGAVVVAAHRELARARSENAALIARTAAEAEQEAERIVAAAHADAASLKAASPDEARVTMQPTSGPDGLWASDVTDADGAFERGEPWASNTWFDVSQDVAESPLWKSEGWVPASTRRDRNGTNGASHDRGEGARSAWFSLVPNVNRRS